MKWPILDAYGIRLMVIPGDQSNAPVRLLVVGADLSTNPDFSRLGTGWVLENASSKFSLSDCRKWFPQIADDIRNYIEDVEARAISLNAAQLDEFIRVGAPGGEPTGGLRKEVDSQEGDKTERIVDAGEKIGGARKDFFNAALSISDLSEMTDVEKTHAVKRDHIWPPLNPEQARSAGLGAEALFAIRAIRRKLNADIKKQYQNGEQFDRDARKYIDMVSAVRDAVMAEPYPKSEAEVYVRFYRALGDLDVITYTPDERDSRYLRSVRSSSGWQEAGRLLGRDLGKLSFRWWDEVVCPMTKKMSGWSNTDDAQGDDEDRQWRNLFPKRVTALPSRSKLENSRAVDADGSIVPHFSHLERSGPDFRNDENVSADRIMREFGFRAVEFGNWLPQVERQEVLNRTFDSFATLAAVMGIERSMIGFKGVLALSFGARGHKGAAAHFEPGRKVVHLTRLSGAGALAHEWGHALDLMIGESALSQMREHKLEVEQAGRFFATEFMVSRTAKAGRQKHYILHNQFPYRFLEAERLASKTSIAFQRWGQAASTLSKVIGRAYVREPDDEDALAEAKRLVQRNHTALRAAVQQSILASDVGNYAQQIKAKLDMLDIALGEGPQSAKAFIGQFVTDQGKYGRQAKAQDQATSLIRAMQSIAQWESSAPETRMPGALSAYRPMMNYVTAFCSAAIDLDKGRSGEYFRKPVEMFARTFESWVFDELAAKNWRDDFLVRVDRADESNDSRFPHGADRVQLRSLMNTFRDSFQSAYDAVDCADSNMEDAQSRMAA